jgi:hypothetical protein
MTSRKAFISVGGLVIGRRGALAGIETEGEIFGVDRHGRCEIWSATKDQKLYERPQLEVFTDAGFAIIDAEASVATVDGWRSIGALRLELLGGAEPVIEHVPFGDFSGGFDVGAYTPTCGIGLSGRKTYAF